MLINNPNHQWIDQNQKMMLIIIQSGSALCSEGGGRREGECQPDFVSVLLQIFHCSPCRAGI